MSTNQRENERSAKKSEKKRKRQRFAWIAIVIIILALLVMKLYEIDFSSISKKDNSGISNAVSDESRFPYELSDGSDVSFGSVGNCVYSLSETSFTSISPSNADVQLDFDHGFANPVIETSSSYSLLYDQGGNSFRLDSVKNNIYQNKSQNVILCGDVSDSGAVALCTTSDKAKTNITVYAKSLSEKFSYDVSYGYVTAVAVDSRGSRLAFAAVNSENAKLKTIVYTMNLNDEQPRAQFEYISSDIIDLEFSSSNLYVIGSDFISVISSLKTEKAVYEQGSVNTVSYCFNSSGNLIYVYSDYSESNENSIAVIKPSGKVSEISKVDSGIKDVSASSSSVSVLTGDAVITYKISNGEEKSRIPVEDSLTAIQQMSSKIFGKNQTLIAYLTEPQE